MNAFSVQFSWLSLPYPLWMGMGGLTLLLLAGFAWQFRARLPSRILVILAFCLLFAAPYITRSTLAPAPPVALILMDQSPSMQIEARTQQAAAALQHLQNELQKNENLQIDRYDVATNAKADTRIASEINSILKKYDAGSIAAVFLITDGQIADANEIDNWPPDGPPLHILLTGTPQARQVYLEAADAPPYAVAGDKAIIRLRAVDSRPSSQNVILSISNGERRWQRKIAINQWENLQLPIAHQGNNRFILSLPRMPDAIFPPAQTAVIDIPAAWGRINILWHSAHTEFPPWLATLADDPMVQIDRNNNANIQFENYNLVLLDNTLGQPMSEEWQNALTAYLQGGGGVMLLQPDAPAPLSPQFAEVLPFIWREDAGEGPLTFTPHALAHPVMASAIADVADLSARSRAALKPDSTATLMATNGKDNAVLALSKFASGRLAVAADPVVFQYTDGDRLFRRILLWLLHDPELSDQTISISEVEGVVQIEYLGQPDAPALQITRPDLTGFEAALRIKGAGLAAASFQADQQGLYIISDGQHEAAYMHGNIMTPEFQKSEATPAYLSPLAAQTGGQVMWLARMAQPKLRWVSARQSGGKDWLPLRMTRSFITTESQSYAVPKSIILLLVGGSLCFAWWRETR